MNDRFITHFDTNEANRSQSVLLELMTILGKYRQHLYLVGGWAPYFLLKIFQRPEDDFQHIGSIDIDIVVDHEHISRTQYASIVELITERGYSPRKSRIGVEIPFSFERTIDGLSVAIDFLAGEYGGTPEQSRHQRVDDGLLARKARGADILPDFHIDFSLDGYLPDGGQQTCEIKMANVVSVLTMKGITISERYKEKDAYDIYAMLAHYKEGPTSCFEEVIPHLDRTLIKEGIQSICDKFILESSVGPMWAAKFMAPDNVAEAHLRQVDIYRQTLPFVQEMKKQLK